MTRTKNARGQNKKINSKDLQKLIKENQQRLHSNNESQNNDENQQNFKVSGEEEKSSDGSGCLKVEENLEEVLDKIDQLIISAEFEEAKESCLKVLKKDPKSLRALENLGLVEVELGNIKSAIKNFNRCIEISKSNNNNLREDEKDLKVSPTIHLYPAQLSNSPTKSLNHFEIALRILNSKLESIQSSKSSIQIDDQDKDKTKKNDSGNGDENSSVEKTQEEKLQLILSEESQIRRSCSRALVGMTEIYLTDLCFDPKAEEKCLDYLKTASELDPTDPEPLQTLASVRISQSNVEGAKEALRLALSLWFDDSDSNPVIKENDVKMDGVEEETKAVVDEDKEMDDGESDLDSDDEDEDEANNNLPPFDTRVQWAKLAIECDMWTEAIEVLYGCEAEDDEDGEVQYLLGMAWYLLGQSRQESKEQQPVPTHATQKIIGSGICDGLDKMECWMEAKECFDTCNQLQEQLGEASGLDQSILSHIKELCQEFQKAGLSVTSAPAAESPALKSGEDNDDGFEDVSDVSMET